MVVKNFISGFHSSIKVENNITKQAKVRGKSFQDNIQNSFKYFSTHPRHSTHLFCLLTGIILQQLSFPFNEKDHQFLLTEIFTWFSEDLRRMFKWRIFGSIHGQSSRVLLDWKEIVARCFPPMGRLKDEWNILLRFRKGLKTNEKTLNTTYLMIKTWFWAKKLSLYCQMGFQSWYWKDHCVNIINRNDWE